MHSSAEAPALQKADKAFIVPRIAHEGYIDALLAICDAQQIGLLVPALEPSLSFYCWRCTGRAFLRSGRFRSCRLRRSLLLVTTNWRRPAFYRAAVFGYRVLLALSMPHARPWREVKLLFRWWLNPRWGVHSIGLQFPEDDEELELCYKLTKKQIGSSLLAEISATDSRRSILIQERLLGEEYGINVINDLNGSYVCTFIKRKIKMRAGLTDRAVTGEHCGQHGNWVAGPENYAGRTLETRCGQRRG
jgi:carbamoyl-phosphate synthase large subunit